VVGGISKIGNVAILDGNITTRVDLLVMEVDNPGFEMAISRQRVRHPAQGLEVALDL
jgi:hypothetical protein